VSDMIAKTYSDMTHDELLALVEKIREGLLKLSTEAADRKLLAEALERCLIEFEIRLEAAKIMVIDPKLSWDNALAAARAFAELIAARTRWENREQTFYEWMPEGIQRTG
jgi:hypothetical protein